MPESIEELYVSIGADVSKLLDDARKGVKETEKELGKFEKRAKGSFDQADQGAQGFGATLNKLKGVASAFIAVFAASTIVNFFRSIGGAAIQANAEFETFATQFETLLGSAGAAKARLEELAQFGVETPFELPQIVEASRVLQVFGGTVLATGDNLRMIGDIAAGVNQPFQDVAFWVGRMYDAIQNGQPFGEASARLQEMGALSGDTRRQLERMQKAGADGAEIFAVFSEQVGGRFAGNMERLSQTFQGVTSNLIDFRDNLLRIGGQSFFEQVRDDAKEFLDIISDEERSAALEKLAVALGDAAAMATSLVTTPLLASLGDIEPETIEDLAESLSDASAALSELVESNASLDITSLLELVTAISDLVTFVTNLKNTTKTASPVIQEFVNALITMISPLGILTDAWDKLNEATEKFTGSSIVEWSRDLAEASQTEAQAQQELIDGYQELAEARSDSTDSAQDVVDASEEAIAAFEKEKAALEGLATDFIDASEELGQKRAELEAEHTEKIQEIESEHGEKMADLAQEHGQKIAELEAEAAKDRVEANKEYQDGIEDLEKETAKKKAEIIEQAKSELSKLETETDQKLIDERDSFQKDELRETEDHLKDMRRLRLNFLDNLGDAVKNRDARAIVDLRRKFNREKSEQESDFQGKQQREREDQDARLAQIREDEARRAAEIMAARDQDLVDLQEHEREKRAELEASLQEQLADIDANLAERRAKENADFEERRAKEQERYEEQLTAENEQFAKRQSELDEALKKRLEAVAKQLADEKDIDEEGAKAILESLNNVFGAGGDIDALMEDFRNRRRQKLTVIVEFDQQIGAPPPPPNAPGAAGSGLGAQNTPNNPGAPGFVGGFAEGGRIIANRPTVALFGEAGPEMATFTPLGQMSTSAMDTQRVEVEAMVDFRGVPPGMDERALREATASVIVSAFRDAGIVNRQ